MTNYSFQTFRLSSGDKFKNDNMKPGTLLKMLLIQEENNRESQRLFYQKYVPSDIFTPLYAKNWININTSEKMEWEKLAFHDLFSMLSSRDHSSSIFDAEKHVKVNILQCV